MALRQATAAAGGRDEDGLLPTSAFGSAASPSIDATAIGVISSSTRPGGASSLSPSPSRDHSTPLTPRRASAMLRGGAAAAVAAAAVPTRQAVGSVLSSWFSRCFLTGVGVLFPLAATAFATLWFLNFFDHLFAPPLEALLGVRVYGLGFATSMAFIFATGVVARSYIGGALIGLGEWVIRRLPLASAVFSAAKQISAAITPPPPSAAGTAAHGAGAGGGGSGGGGVGGSFRECVLVKNPRFGNYMLGFVTGATTIRGVPAAVGGGSSLKVSATAAGAAAPSTQEGGLDDGGSGGSFRGVGGNKATSPTTTTDLDLVAVYASSNHLVFGDVFLVPRSEVVRTSLSVREGIEVIVSMGMALPRELVALPH